MSQKFGVTCIMRGKSLELCFECNVTAWVINVYCYTKHYNVTGVTLCVGVILPVVTEEVFRWWGCREGSFVPTRVLN